MTKKKIFIIGGAFLGLVLIGAIYNSTDPGKQQAIADSIVTVKQKRANDSAAISDGYKNLKIEAFVTANHFCEKKLKSPSTAEFGHIWSENCGVVTDDDTDINGVLTSISHKIGVSIPNITQFRVVNYVDAENSFGAKIRNWYRIKLSYNKTENIWTLNDIYLGETLN